MWSQSPQSFMIVYIMGIQWHGSIIQNFCIWLWKSDRYETCLSEIRDRNLTEYRKGLFSNIWTRSVGLWSLREEKEVVHLKNCHSLLPRANCRTMAQEGGTWAENGDLDKLKIHWLEFGEAKSAVICGTEYWVGGRYRKKGLQ